VNLFILVFQQLFKEIINNKLIYYIYNYIINNQLKTKNTMLITITNEEKVQVTLAPTTVAGNPATLDGAPTWTIIEGDATLEVAADGLSAFLVSGAADVNSKVEVSADADLGEGVVTLTDTIDLAVVAASASALGAVVATPVLK